MFNLVLVPVVILAVVLCCTVPLPVVASVAASGLLSWLFVAYRNSLGAMSGATSGLECGRSGLLEFASLSPRMGLRPVEKGDSGLGGRGAESSGPFGARMSSPGGPSGAATSQRGVAESPRNSSRSGGFDEPFSPVSSPSLSILSRSSYRDNLSYRSDDRAGGSPMLPPGSYPWLMPPSASGAKKRINLEAVPVKIKVSKPTASFLPVSDVSEGEPRKMESSKQIIQALKAMSRKRLHTSESDDSREESFGAVPKRRPMDYHHNLYASHLGSDSSFQGSSEILEDVAVDQRMANGSAPNLNASSNAGLGSPPNNGVVNNQPVSNKRPRATNDGGNQTAKKRNHFNNEILSSLSSSLALLDPTIMQRRMVKKRESTANKEPPKRAKTLETHCVEVQTLPSPILKEDAARTKEDKGTGTDRITEGTFTRSTQSGVTEKKVTDKMAAALLKSALMKFANSGELVTPETSANSNSILSESPLSKSDVADKREVQKSVRFTLPDDTPKTSESAPETSSVLTATSVVDAESSKPLGISFGNSSIQTSAPAVTSSPALVAPKVTSVGAPSLPGFNVGGSNSMAITPSPTENGGLFSFGSSAAPKLDSAASSAQKTPEPQVSVAASAATTFGAQVTAAKPSFSFGAPTPTPSVAPEGQKAQVSVAAASSVTTFGAPAAVAKPSFSFGAPNPTPVAPESQNTTVAVSAANTDNKGSPFRFGQTTVTTPVQPAVNSGFKLSGATTPAVATTSSAQTAASKPGGFAFTPTAKFTFGASTTSTTSTVATPSVQPPIAAPLQSAVSTSSTPATTTQSAVSPFSFGNSTFGASKPAETGSKGLFGMPPPPSKPANAEPPKLFGATGGFNFSAPSKDPAPAFPQTTPKPEEKKPEGFAFGGFGQKTEPAKPFAFGAAGAGQSKPTAPAFAFGASSGQQPAFGSFSSKPADPPVFNPPATTSSSLFGSAAPSATSSGVSFGAAPKTTAPSFGSSTMTSTTTASAAPTFGSGLSAPAFGSAAPSFGSSAPAFGASAMTFGSGSAGFGSTNPPTFGSVAGAPSATTTSTPAPAFGSGATSTPQFGASTFGSSSSVPAFGSSFGAAPAFGSTQTTTQQSAPAFGAPQAAQAAPLTFGAPQTTTQAAPTFGAQTTSQSPFSFSGAPQPAAPASGGFNFQAPAASGAPKPMFQFGAAGAPAQPSAPQPFAFSGAPAPAPMGGGFGNTMFSIGSGTAAPRTRTTLRARKK